jgi:hypothetical protein
VLYKKACKELGILRFNFIFFPFEQTSRSFLLGTGGSSQKLTKLLFKSNIMLPLFYSIETIEKKW